MVKKRKKKIKSRSKFTYSDYVFKGLKDFGIVFVFFLIIAVNNIPKTND